MTSSNGSFALLSCTFGRTPKDTVVTKRGDRSVNGSRLVFNAASIVRGTRLGSKAVARAVGVIIVKSGAFGQANVLARKASCALAMPRNLISRLRIISRGRTILSFGKGTRDRRTGSVSMARLALGPAMFGRSSVRGLSTRLDFSFLGPCRIVVKSLKVNTKRRCKG